MDETFCVYKNIEVCSDSQDSLKNCDFTCMDYSYDEHKLFFIRAKRCDGRGTCRIDIDEEECEGCPDKPHFCDRVIRHGPYVCQSAFAPLPCDEIIDCPDYSDELDCPNRFYCRKDPPHHIAVEKVCDLRKDCPNSEDEMDCQNHTTCTDSAFRTTSSCASTHFYCDNTYIDAKKVCNGDKDCDSGLDECQECFKIFSNDQFMIKYNEMLPFMWAIGLCAVIGNAAAFGLTFQSSIKNRKKLSALQKSQTIVLLNLSLGDFLVGIYILAICVLNETMNKGNYCQIDQEWRSSLACSILGGIVMTGSEESVFMLTIITAIRMRSVLKPFEKLSVKLVLLMSGLSWIMSIGLAVFPLVSIAPDYFVEKLWYSDNPFISYVYQHQVPEYNRRLGAYFNQSGSSSEIKSWKNFKEMILKINSNYTPEREFGYYTKYSVCLPRLFPDAAEDETWAYTFVIIVINFLGFVWITFGYFVIYQKSTNPNVRRTSNAAITAKLQKKVTMIIVTDMLCWIPIAIFGFMRLAGVYIPAGLYAAIGIILLPINSAINPFLYTDIPSIIWKIIQRCVQGLQTLNSKFTTFRKHISQQNGRQTQQANREEAGQEQRSKAMV